MQNFIRSHEETIYVLRQATAEHERQLEEACRLQVKIGRKCREEAERASRSERLTELLEQRNKQLELDYAKLTRKVDGLLRAIHPV